MHGYWRSRKRLLKKLGAFRDGQFRIESPNGATFQGEFSECVIPDLGIKALEVNFKWIAGLKYTLGEGWKPQEYWWKLDKPKKPLPVKFTYYYFQRRRHGIRGKSNREERIKLLTPDGEVCRIYKVGDPLTLIESEGRFLPLSPPVD